jgi:ABC-2 type transport system permease protein
VTRLLSEIDRDERQEIVASVFPLKWVAQGMRSGFLPSTFEAAEAGGSWNLACTGIATAIWLVAGLVLVRVTFRWIRKDS